LPKLGLFGRRRRQQQQGGKPRDLPDARRHRLDVRSLHQDDDLKAAAKDLVDIVIWDDQSAYTSKIALSPFAPAVNVGSTYFTQLTNKADRTDNDGSNSKNIHYPSSCIRDDGSVRRSCRDSEDPDYDSPPYIASYAKCVVERGGSERYTDAAPAVGAWLPTWNDNANSMTKSCSPSAQIVPLSKNRQTLKVDREVVAISRRRWTRRACDLSGR